MYKPAIEGFPEANKELFDVGELITQKTHELNDAREKYLYAKALWENNYARYLLETKVKNLEMTQEEIKASATNLAYEDKLTAIKAESSYKKLVNEIKALRDKISVLQEISWNLRKERIQG